MFLSKKIHLTNNVRHRRELLWDSFLNKKIKESYKKQHFNHIVEYKLPAYCVKGYFFNKYNKKIYTILTSSCNNNIITPVKYGLKVGDCLSTHYYDLLIKKKEGVIEPNKILLALCTSGTLIYFIRNAANGNKLAVSNGVFAIVYKQVTSTHLTKLKLPSGQIKYIPDVSEAYAGRHGNIYFKYVVWGSWGQKNRFKQHRPIVRGVAMNPIDHPNGGRSKIKKPSRNKYNKIAKKGK